MRCTAVLLLLLFGFVSLPAAEPDSTKSYGSVIMASLGYLHSPLSDFNERIAAAGFNELDAPIGTGSFEWAFINGPKHMQSIALEYYATRGLDRSVPLQPLREFQVSAMAAYLNSGMPVYNDGFHRLMFRVDLGLGLTTLTSALKQDFQTVLDGNPAEKNSISQASLLFRVGFRHEFRFDSEAETPFPIGVRIGYSFTLTTEDWTNSDAFLSAGMQVSGAPKAQYTGFSAAVDVPIAIF